MSNQSRLIIPLLIVVLLALTPAATALETAQQVYERAEDLEEPVDPDALVDPDPKKLIERAVNQATSAAEEVIRFVDDATAPGDDEGGADDDGKDERDPSSPGILNGLLGALGANGYVVAGALALTAFAGAGLLMGTRYLTPREVLKKPQRAMLYGCIKGNPGVNLKQLSEDFDMKTSTVLWHIRKLESADLVRSQKANGLRVFYPVAGGLAAKRLGLAVATLANPNAARILDYIAVNPGIAQKNLVNNLAINAGTVRWHLRKLKDMNLMSELAQGRMCTYYVTELGIKALKQAQGLSSDAKAVPDIVGEVEGEHAAPS